MKYHNGLSGYQSLTVEQQKLINQKMKDAGVIECPIRIVRATNTFLPNEKRRIIVGEFEVVTEKKGTL